MGSGILFCGRFMIPWAMTMIGYLIAELRDSISCRSTSASSCICARSVFNFLQNSAAAGKNTKSNCTRYKVALRLNVYDSTTLSTLELLYTEHQRQRCDDASDTGLIENNGVTPEWGCNLNLQWLNCFQSEQYYAIAVLTLNVNGILKHIHTNRLEFIDWVCGGLGFFYTYHLSHDFCQWHLWRHV